MNKQNLKFEVNNVTFEMIVVEGGTFNMGDTYDCGRVNENPIHSVTLSDYYIGKTVVTQELWEAVVGNNPSYIKESNLPIERISWVDCRRVIRKLNVATGKIFRLPTEAEWEYAAKGGNKSKGYKYSGSNNLNKVAWYNNVRAVGTKDPNELDIYGMSGNIWEWCSDRYGYYIISDQTNPKGPLYGSYRVIRGCKWIYYVKNCHITYRSFSNPKNNTLGTGFRLVLNDENITNNEK